MFSQNPRTDYFTVIVPDKFFRTDVIAKYNEVIAQRQYPFSTIEEMLLESIQSFNTPDFGYTVNNQTVQDGSFAGYDSGTTSKESIQKLTEKTFTITFRHTDGFMTYWMLLELFFAAYTMGPDNPNRKDFGQVIFETRMPDGQSICRVKYNQCRLVGVPGLMFTYASPTRDFSTFECTFAYNTFETAFDMPTLKLKA